jgi:hypothetical protein
MPAHSWATHEQIQFLRSCCADFANAQSAVPKQLNEFWKIIEQDFFLQWPDQAAEAISRSKMTVMICSKRRSKRRQKPPPLPLTW